MKKKIALLSGIMGVGLLLPSPAEAVKIRVDESSYLNVMYRQKIKAVFEDEGASFGIDGARITMKGQIGGVVYFGTNIDATTKGGEGDSIFREKVTDAFFGLKLHDAFRIQAGLFRVPFSRVSLTTSYGYIVPTGYNESNLFNVLGTDGKFRDGQLVIWGNVAGGLIKYHLAYGNGIVGTGAEENAIGARIQFTPTMLGFKPEKGYVQKDTYLGKKNVLSIGLGYQSEQLKTGTITGIAADLFWEQNFGAVVPGLQLGYIQWKPEKQDANTLTYAQGSIVSGQKIGLGQLGLSVKWVSENQNKQQDSYIDVYLGYYLAGHKAVIFVGADKVSSTKDKDKTKPTLYLRSMFEREKKQKGAVLSAPLYL